LCFIFLFLFIIIFLRGAAAGQYLCFIWVASSSLRDWYFVIWYFAGILFDYFI